MVTPATTPNSGVTVYACALLQRGVEMKTTGGREKKEFQGVLSYNLIEIGLILTIHHLMYCIEIHQYIRIWSI